ncbi:hypothetical protein MMPV_003511 [Pyropia vietnamensis]
MGFVVVPGVAPTRLPDLVSNLFVLAVGVVGVVVVAATAVGPASAAPRCVTVPIHQMLSAPGGIHRLSDGREFKASVVEVGGCPSVSYIPTGSAYPDGASNYTVISAQFNATASDSGSSSSACVTETGLSAGTSPPVLSGFQAILIEANGFRFSTDMVLEDIDAEAQTPLSAGWREMMTSLGMAGGQVVRPAFSSSPGSFVGVQPFQIKEAALEAVGFPSSADMTIDGVAYNTQTLGKNCVFQNDSAGECKAHITYDDAVDRLLIAFAATRASSTDPDSSAFMSAISLSRGCQCSAHQRSNAAKPVAGSPGKCTTVAVSTPGYSCDMLGTSWCETRVGTRWVMTGEGDNCVEKPNTYSQVVSTFNPDPDFK